MDTILQSVVSAVIVAGLGGGGYLLKYLLIDKRKAHIDTKKTLIDVVQGLEENLNKSIIHRGELQERIERQQRTINRMETEFAEMKAELQRLREREEQCQKERRAAENKVIELEDRMRTLEAGLN